MWGMWGTWSMMGNTGYTGTLVTQVHGVCGLQGYSNHAVFFLSVSHTIFGCVHKNVKICQIEKWQIIQMKERYIFIVFIVIMTYNSQSCLRIYLGLIGWKNCEISCFQSLVFRSPGDLTGTSTTSNNMSNNTRDETDDITDSLESDDVDDHDDKSDIAAAYLDMLSSFV